MKKAHFTFLILFSAFVLFSCKEKKEITAVNPIEVPVVQVMQQDVALESEYTGQTYGESDVEIRSRVEGWVLTMNFREGTMIKKGQLLYTIDPLQYQNQVDQAAASLAQAQTSMIKAKNEEPLARENLLPQKQRMKQARQWWNLQKLPCEMLS
jgi:membrane fusion protein (multidrug efflux system)